jgi:hypothetical protein
MILNKYFNDENLRQAEQEAKDFKSRETLVYMRPRDFVKLAPTLSSVTSLITEDLVTLIEDDGKFRDIPYFKTEMISKKVFKIMGHEGRHRSLAFLHLNMKGNIPVRLIDRDTRWLEDGYKDKTIKLIAQKGSYNQKVEL